MVDEGERRRRRIRGTRESRAAQADAPEATETAEPTGAVAEPAPEPAPELAPAPEAERPVPRRGGPAAWIQSAARSVTRERGDPDRADTPKPPRSPWRPRIGGRDQAAPADARDSRAPGRPPAGDTRHGERRDHPDARRGENPDAARGEHPAEPYDAHSSTDDRDSERGLRGLVGGGSSQVSIGAAMRARDASRPTDADIAAAETGLTIVHRGWVPRDP